MSHGHVRGTCQQAVGAMTDLIDGALAPGDLAPIHAHLADCPRCRELLDSLRTLPAAIRQLSQGPERGEQARLEARILAALGLRAS